MIRFPSNSRESERRRQYAKIRDALEGEDRIKAGGANYLPKFDGETRTAFNNRLARTAFPNFVAPMLNSMVGKAFRIAPLIKFVDDRQPFLFRGDECTFHWGAEYVFREVATTGRIFAVVVPSEDPDVSRSAPARIQLYEAECIKRVTHKKGVLLSVVVEDACCAEDELLEYRIGEDGLFEAAFVGTEGETRRVAFPSILGRRLRYIPAVFVGPNDLSPEPDRPPLIDLVNAILHHYILQSEWRTALHWTSSPQPVAVGFAAEEVPRVIGPSTIIRSANPDARFEFATFRGDGIAEQRLALAASRADMAAIGASLLLPKGASNVAARTVELRQNEDNSLVISIVNSVEAGLNRLIGYMLDWEGKSAAQASVTLNRDMVEATIDSNLLLRLREAYQAGMISWTTWCEALQRGEILPAARSAEDERGLIESDTYHDTLPDGPLQ